MERKRQRDIDDVESTWPAKRANYGNPPRGIQPMFPMIRGAGLRATESAGGAPAPPYSTVQKRGTPSAIAPPTAPLRISSPTLGTDRRSTFAFSTKINSPHSSFSAAAADPFADISPLSTPPLKQRSLPRPDLPTNKEYPPYMLESEVPPPLPSKTTARKRIDSSRSLTALTVRDLVDGIAKKGSHLYLKSGLNDRPLQTIELFGILSRIIESPSPKSARWLVAVKDSTSSSELLLEYWEHPPEVTDFQAGVAYRFLGSLVIPDQHDAHDRKFQCFWFKKLDDPADMQAAKSMAAIMQQRITSKEQ